jgi:ElaB/YqjD/DUF883 family membrane-anchored ribosome-binding protein
MNNTNVKTRSRANRTYSPAMRALRRQAKTVTHDARGLAESAGAVAREQLDPVKGYVLDKPIQSLLIAAGVGLFLGFLFTRR